MNATQILNRVVAGQDLTVEESKIFLTQIMKGEVAPTQIAAIFIALRMKGESVKEMVGFVSAMRDHMLKVNMKNAIDVCGTGGDGKETFNISTAVSFVVAGCGVKVAKHGNRAASSKCGSADVLEALGVHIQLTPIQAEDIFKKVGTVFLFAPLYHPAMKHVVGVRKELKIRTVFNFLGPFVSPASCKKQMIGVPNNEIAEKLAKVGKNLGYERLLIVTSKDGLDEVSISANTTAYELKNNVVTKLTINPEDYGIKKVSQQKIRGGDAKYNALIIRELLNGKKGPERDIVVLNSACALYMEGSVLTIMDGIRRAEKSIDSGQAMTMLENLIKETKKYA